VALNGLFCADVSLGNYSLTRVFINTMVTMFLHLQTVYQYVSAHKACTCILPPSLHTSISRDWHFAL